MHSRTFTFLWLLCSHIFEASNDQNHIILYTKTIFAAADNQFTDAVGGGYVCSSSSVWLISGMDNWLWHLKTTTPKLHIIFAFSVTASRIWVSISLGPLNAVQKPIIPNMCLTSDTSLPSHTDLSNTAVRNMTDSTRRIDIITKVQGGRRSVSSMLTWWKPR